jgi:hypothetical protein
VDAETTISFSAQTVRNAMLMYVTNGETIPRPNGEQVWVIHWEDAGMLIMWPEGMTATEAVRAWMRGESYGR